MGIRMFDVDPSQAEEGLDGQVAEEDLNQGEGPPEDRDGNVASRPANAPRYGVKFEEGKAVPKEKHVPKSSSETVYTSDGAREAADEALTFAQELADEEAAMEEDNHGLRYALRPIKSWVLGRIEWPMEIIDELNAHIDDVVIPANENYGEGLVGQFKQNEKSAQLNFDLTSETGKQLKTILDQIGTTYLKSGYDRDARADCFQAWTNHAYAGDYNPFHDHGVQTPAGISAYLYLKVPPCIEELPEVNPQIKDSGGGIDGFTHLVWGLNSRRDIMMLKPQTEEYIKPMVGTMCVFPQWLKHQVIPFFGEGERRTLAINWNVHDSDTEMRKLMSEREFTQYLETKSTLSDKLISKDD